MVEQQVRPWDVLDARVLDTIATLPREAFVPQAVRSLAYADTALPLAHGETMMKPVLEGRTLQSLLPQSQESVLEIGTGSGLPHCLPGASLPRSRQPGTAPRPGRRRPRATLSAQGIANAEVITADALAWTTDRSFDAICVTGAVDRIPARFTDWLKPGGRLFVVRGRSPAMEAVLVHRDVNGLRTESLFETDLPYLAGAAPAPAFAL
jgi:protein-L-isoaspartate(D-aspartate) O-methyltransferase